MQLLQHQVRGSKEIQHLIKDKMLAIVHAPERSGKTLMTIDAITNLPFKRVLVITKKKAIDGWLEDIETYNNNFEVKEGKEIQIINYESLHKVTIQPELIIIDEFHYSISSFPKTPAKAKLIRDNWLDVPKIYISATPAPENGSQWFHPLWLCSHHPFSKYKNFYEWAYKFVDIELVSYGHGTVKDYSKAKIDEVMQYIRPYLIQIKREETGIKFQPSIVPVYIDLEPRTIALIEKLKRDRILGRTFIADTPVKLINGMYQLECGCLKIDDVYHDLGNREHIDYIKSNFGDSEDVAIMTRWIGERKIMQREFKKALILSSHSHAEGVELSHVEHLIISSLDYSTARYQQRNARQASIKRKTPIKVHVLMSKDQVSEAVFKTVALKHQDFKARMFMQYIPPHHSLQGKIKNERTDHTKRDYQVS